MLIVLLLSLLLVAVAAASLAAHQSVEIEAKLAAQPVRVEQRRRR